VQLTVALTGYAGLMMMMMIIIIIFFFFFIIIFIMLQTVCGSMRVVKARHAAYYTTFYIPFSMALVGVPPVLIA